MKSLKFLILIFAIAINNGCSKSDNSSAVEDGINRSPNQKPTGSSAYDLLSSDKYKSLVVEVNYVENLRPNSQTLLNLKQFLQNRINKPVGISIIEKQIPVQSGSPFTINEVSSIEDANRAQYNTSDVLKVHLLFLNGASENDTSAAKNLGIAYRNTSCVLFETSIQGYSDAVNEPSRVDLETTVITHEICHLLGLVNLGTSMQTNHLDNAHDKHCNNTACLMYWAIENNNVLQMMTSGNVPQLDANCLNDLHSNGGK